MPADGQESIYRGRLFFVAVSDDPLSVDLVIRRLDGTGQYTLAEARNLRGESQGEVRDEIDAALAACERWQRGQGR
jgi:hypothetical protein